MSSSLSLGSRLAGRSPLQWLIDLRLTYAAVSSGLVLVGLFWHRLVGIDWRIVALFFGFFCVNVFGFVINDFYDATYDAREPRKRARNVFCRAATRLLGTAVLYGSLGASLVLGAIVSPTVLVLVVLSDVLAYGYSAPPIRLRDRRYWDWLFVFLWKGIIVFAGYYHVYGLTWPRDPFVVGSLVVLLVPSLISQIYNQLRDFRVDSATHTPNTVQRAGAGGAGVLNRLLIAVFYAFSLVFCAWFGLYHTLFLVLCNVALYRFVTPGKARYVVELANVWIVILFLERSAASFGVLMRVFASVLIVAMAGLSLLHVRRARVFA